MAKAYWRPLYPTSSTKLKDLPDIHQENFTAIASGSRMEHISMTASATSGQHVLGGAGMLYEGTTVQIGALAYPPSGAIAFDTTLGLLVYYDGTNWVSFATKRSRFRGYPTANIAITANTDWQALSADTEDYDTLAEHSSGGVFTTLASGYYMVIGALSVMGSGSDAESAVCTATGNVDVSWSPYPAGAGTNWQRIDEWDPIDDTDYIRTPTLNNADVFSGTAIDVAPAIDEGEVTVTFRHRNQGCLCNAVCYQQTCVCQATCYGGHADCSCNAACYGYGGCGCDGYSYCD